MQWLTAYPVSQLGTYGTYLLSMYPIYSGTLEMRDVVMANPKKPHNQN